MALPSRLPAAADSGVRLSATAERVLADVRSGYVSLEAARRDYGVVIRQHGRRFELDIEATAELRQGRESTR